MKVKKAKGKERNLDKQGKEEKIKKGRKVRKGN